MSDRFRVACADARDFVTDEPFDRVFWSQFFFPQEGRPGTLAAAFAALRPGGTVTVPLVDDSPRSALWRAMLAGWGVPMRTAEELAAEFGAAGFNDADVLGADLPGPTSVRAHRP